MMDGDLQDPPEVLPKMWELLRDDAYDMAYGHRTDRAEGWGRQLLIKSFHGIFSNFSKLKEADNVGNFSMLNRRALTAFLSLQEKNRYLPGLRSFIGYRQAGVSYARHARPDGTVPKMSYSRLFALALDALFSFSDLPIKVCLYSGVFGIIVFMLRGHLRADEQSRGRGPAGLVVAGTEFVFPGLHSAALSGHNGRVRVPHLPRKPEPAALFRSAVLCLTFRRARMLAALDGARILSLVLAVGLVYYRDYGLSTDEDQSRDNGMVTLKHVAMKIAPGWVADRPVTLRIYQVPLSEYYDRDYGVAFETPVCSYRAPVCT